MFDRVRVVGDQKTMERGVEAQFLSADWHHENKFLSVSF